MKMNRTIERIYRNGRHVGYDVKLGAGIVASCLFTRARHRERALAEARFMRDEWEPSMGGYWEDRGGWSCLLLVPRAVAA